MTDAELAERDAARRQRDWETICRVVDRLQEEMPHLSYFDADAFSGDTSNREGNRTIRARILQSAENALPQKRQHYV